jgi:hypothetical protein
MALNDTASAGSSAPRRTTAVPSVTWSAVYGAGMALLFCGERIIDTGKGRLVCSILGLVAVLVAFVARLARIRGAAPDRRAVERRLLAMYGLGLLSLVLYAVQSDLPTLRGGRLLEASSPKLATVLAAIWPALWTASAFSVIAMELAYAPMYRAPRLEVGRVRAAQLSGLGLAFTAIFAMAVGYVATQRDKKVDLAYFRTTRPGESTVKIVRALDQPLTVAIFFPNANEVREEVDSYFADLGKESNQLKVLHYDYDLDPLKAKEFGVSANGILVFQRGGRKEQLGLQLQIENARTALKNLDREVQQRLLQVSRSGRVTFLTQGHGERTNEPNSETDRRPGVRELRNLLMDQGHDVRDLGPVEGLANDVPKDAALVMILGPTKPFPPEEVASLQRYLDRGGRIYMALDPDGGANFSELLEPLGLKLSMKTLANDQVYGRRSHQDSDRNILVTGLYSSHPSVGTLSRVAMRAPVVMLGATAIIGPGPHDRAGKNKDVVIDYTVHAHPATFSDDNGDYRPDPNETRKSWELAAAVSKKVEPPPADKAADAKAAADKDKDKGKAEKDRADKNELRLFLVGDSDFLTDRALGAYGNPMLVIDPVRWLLGDESFIGQISTEVDVPITHTRKQDVVWFYSSIFLAPALVVTLGFLTTRRRRRSRAGRAMPFEGDSGVHSSGSKGGAA